MSIDAADTRSRRALLLGAIGGVSALAAHALGRPSAMLAGGGSVQLGATNTSTATTTIQNANTGDVPLVARNNGGTALVGNGTTIGVAGVGNPGPGVRGLSMDGLSPARVPTRVGVQGLGDRVGVQGSSPNHVGVLGMAGDGAPAPSMPPNVGVYGWSTAESLGVSMGLLGRSTAPIGYGVFGTSDTGTGVQAITKNGSALAATVSTGGTGRALNVAGRVKFSTSGLATVASGSNQKIVNPGIPLSGTSKVLATLMGNAGGSVTVKRVAVDAAADTFTIFLTGASANDVSVAWFVLE